MRRAQMFRAALIAVTVLILSSGLERSGIRSEKLATRDQEYCPGSRGLGGWIVLVQGDCASRSEGLSRGRGAKSFDLVG